MSTFKLPPTYYCGDPLRGAAMGRPSRGLNAGPTNERVSLQRIRLSGAYDNGGAYWGAPDDLWRAATPGEEREIFFRADNRDQARTHVARLWPDARFYR